MNNEYGINVNTAARMHGFDDADHLLEEIGHDSVIPACCSEGCEVEPDGRCEHGCPSVLLALGVI